MDDNKKNPAGNQPTFVGASAGEPVDKPFDVSPDKARDTPQDKSDKSINQSVNMPVYESVPEEELKPEEVAPDVEVTGGESVVSPEDSQIPGDVPPPVSYEGSRSKYFIAIGGVVFFLIVLFLLLRLFLGGKGPAAVVSLTYWGLWEEKETLDPLIEDYQRKNPNVKINYQKMSPEDYREKLLARSKNGEGPDLFRFHNTWPAQIKDVLAPLPKSIMSNSDFEKTFYKIHQDDLKIEDSYYGIPLYVDGLVLIYNNGLFKKAGIATAPTNWDDLTDIVAKLTVKDASGQIVTAGIALGLASNVDHFSDILGLMLVQNGASLKSLGEPEAVGALESYRKFAEQPNNFWDEKMPNSITAFTQEKVAMIFVPTWEIPLIKSANPDLELKVVPVPAVPGSKPVSLANYWVDGVSRYSKNQLEAWKFLSYLAQKDNMTKLYELESKVRLFGEPYSRVDLGSILAQNEYVGAVIKQTDTYKTLPLVSRTYDNGLNDEIIQYLENAINATVDGVSYAEAMATAKQGVDQIFEKYKIQ